MGVLELSREKEEIERKKKVKRENAREKVTRDEGKS